VGIEASVVSRSRWRGRSGCASRSSTAGSRCRFDETNSATAARDLDSSTKDIYGATDRSIGAAATVVAY